MNEDSNIIIRTYLAAKTTLTDTLASVNSIYHPRLPENAALPAVSFFTRGGSASPYIPGIVIPSIQFDCWAASPIAARVVYRALYDVLQGVQNQAVTTDDGDYLIHSAMEEVQGQDLVDEIPNYFKVLTFFSIMIRALED